MGHRFGPQDRKRILQAVLRRIERHQHFGAQRFGTGLARLAGDGFRYFSFSGMKRALKVLDYAQPLAHGSVRPCCLGSPGPGYRRLHIGKSSALKFAQDFAAGGIGGDDAHGDLAGRQQKTIITQFTAETRR